MTHRNLYSNIISIVIILVLSVVLVRYTKASSPLQTCATPGETTSGCVTETSVPPSENTATARPTYLPTYYTRVAPTATNVPPTNTYKTATARPTYLPTYYTRVAPTATNVPPTNTYKTATPRPTYLPTYYTRVAP